MKISNLAVEGSLGGDHADIYRETITSEPFHPSWQGGTFKWVTNLDEWAWLKVTDKVTGQTWEREWEY